MSTLNEQAAVAPEPKANQEGSTPPFRRALAFVLKVEGGYTNDPVDRGGATNKGILQRVYDTYRKAEGLRPADVRRILDIEVEEIYRDAYWLEGDCDRMAWPVSLVHFDACVNTGVTQAAKFLQRSVGAEPDGRIGPKTLAALRAVLERETPLALAERLVRRREPFYRRLAEADPTQNRFLQGWLNRVEKLKTASGIA
jgi:lysozyme family protein